MHYEETFNESIKRTMRKNVPFTCVINVYRGCFYAVFVETIYVSRKVTSERVIIQVLNKQWMNASS